MNYQNVATIINNASKLLVLDASGTAISLLPDLSNLLDFGTALDDLTSDQLKTFQKNLVVGVYNEIIVRTLKRVEFGFSKTTEEYGGALQRIVSNEMLEAQDSHLLNLVNGQSYLDGKFYGIPTDSKIFQDTKAFKVVYSISEDTFKNYFMNARELANYMGYISIVAQNSINKKLNTWECALLAGLINSASEDNTVSITKSFNAEILGNVESSANYKSLADIIKDKDLFIQWSNYAKAIIEILTSRISDVTIGDGMTTPKEKVMIVLNQKFESFVKNMANSYLLNVTDFPTHKTVNAWNVSEKIAITNNGDTRTFDSNVIGGDFDGTNSNLLAYIKNGSTNTEAEYKNGVVGIVYDSDCAGITTRSDKVTLEEVGAEGFRNLHHHLVLDMYVDNRFKNYVITL